MNGQDPNMMGEETWAMRAEQNSRPAFEAIQQIVREFFGSWDFMGKNPTVQSLTSVLFVLNQQVMAFGQVSMMLDASFGAMFQSFRAVIGVMDHFGRMRYVGCCSVECAYLSVSF
jgi:hypothetical protein